jgi:transposase
MFYVGIDISKYKHDCCVISDAGEVIISKLTINNDHAGFSKLQSILDDLNDPQKIRIGFEATAHYANNLKLFLERIHYNFMEFNPVLLSRFLKGQTLRKTKSDTIDALAIAKWLMTVEYKPHPSGFYHMYSLKSLTRLRDSLVRQRSYYLVKITNVLDHTFPEFKPFFNNRFSVTALYLLSKYHTAEAISKINARSYDTIRKLSRGRFTLNKFFALKEIAANSVGQSNEIFEFQLSALLDLHEQLSLKVEGLEHQIIEIIDFLDPPTLSIHGVGPLSAAVIVSEFGDVSNFKSPAQMLSFAGLEPGYFQSGLSEHTGRMVKHGSSHLRFTLMNLCIPLIRFNPIFAQYYHKKRKEGKSHRVACSHLCKKLLRVIYTLETKSIKYNFSELR